MNNTKVQNGFTVIELLVALAVTAVVLSAVATLAFAMSSATRASEDTAFTQTEVRTATLRLAELVRNCCMICAVSGHDLVIWKSDDNQDERINLNEVVYLERGAAHNTLQIGQFSSGIGNPVVAFSSLAGLAATYGKTDLTLIRSCSEVQFAWDQAPPRTRRLTISFDLTEGDAEHHYEIELRMLGSSAHLLNSDATDLVTQDDD
jgi:prepilin-type N-terminal cleavage/methylation domain-containing protein